MNKNIKKRFKELQKEINSLKTILAVKEITYSFLKLLVELDISITEMINEVFGDE